MNISSLNLKHRCASRNIIKFALWLSILVALVCNAQVYNHNTLASGTCVYIQGLKLPVYNAKHTEITSYRDVKFTIDNSGNRKTAPVLMDLLAQFKAQVKNKKLILSKAQFEKHVVIPYILGLWTDSKSGLFRTSYASMVVDKLMDPLKMPDYTAGDGAYTKMGVNWGAKVKGGNGYWPLYYPNWNAKLKRSILAHIHAHYGLPGRYSYKKIALFPLPDKANYLKTHPMGGTDSAPHQLFNREGLLFVPNSYVVPGGIFNQLFGWDSYFIVQGLLSSAQYLLNTPDAQIYTYHQNGGQLQTLTSKERKERATALVDLAKGIVDDHIFEIDFYGGYVENLNTLYDMLRSQPPLFSAEALLVYRFALKHHIPYQETLAPYLSNTRSTKGFKTPKTYQQWLSREVLPAAIIYYDYYTDKHLRYLDWDPYTSADEKTQNPRVINVSAGKNNYQLSRYYSPQIGPNVDPVCAYNTSGGSNYYEQVANYFQRRDPKHIFFSEKSGDKKYHLTQNFYKADFAVRASGFDLSGRYGRYGQYSVDYASVALNSLLFKMGEDIRTMMGLVHTKPLHAYGLSAKQIAKHIQKVEAYNAHLAEAINHVMMSPAIKAYADVAIADSDRGLMSYPIPRHPENKKHRGYLYGTSFFPYFSQHLVQSEQFHIGDNLLLPSQWHLAAKIVQRYGLKTYHATRSYGVNTSLDNDIAGSARTQWDFPALWAPVQYFALQAVRNSKVQQSIAESWLNTVDLYFAMHGIIIEKYNAIDPLADVRVTAGYTINNAGFGWTNATYMLAKQMLHSSAQ